MKATKRAVVAVTIAATACGGPTDRDRAAKIDYCEDLVTAPASVQTAYARLVYPAVVKVLREQFHAADHPERLASVQSAPKSPPNAMIATLRTRLVASCTSPREIPTVQLMGNYLSGKYGFP